ncbi:helix-turn-helix transcriptional regulator [Deltaproteobacteria bacterium OttesenSCG-928-M10]|nr:helix-turn-helix transcriptional regulator [Deltaproteobacteria bacterium OttesenSCG-928-M10]
MLEPTKKPHIEEVRFQVVCDKANLKKITAALKPFKCTISPAKPAVAPESSSTVPAPNPSEKDWYTIDDLFHERKPGDALKAYRYRENLSQKQLAEMVGISVPNLSHMENGRRPVGKEMAKRLAKALNTDWRLLL